MVSWIHYHCLVNNSYLFPTSPDTTQKTVEVSTSSDGLTRPLSHVLRREVPPDEKWMRRNGKPS